MADVRIPLADTIRALRRELEAAVQEGRGNELRFDLGPIELELQIEMTQEKGGDAGVSFWVVSVGGKATETSATTHTVRLTLTPVGPEGKVLVADEVPDRPG